MVYLPVEAPEWMEKFRVRFPCDYGFVSDFRGGFSPMKIRYGAQTTPTCFLVDPRGVIRVKSAGLAPERYEAELACLRRM